MKVFVSFLFCCLSCSAMLFAQSTYQKVIPFEFDFNRGSKGFALDATLATNEGIFVYGEQFETLFGPPVAYYDAPALLKLTNEGVLEWYKLYENSDFLSLGARSQSDVIDLIELDKGIFMACRSNQARSTQQLRGIISFFIAFDSDGNKIWEYGVVGRIISNLMKAKNGHVKFTLQQFDQFFLIEIDQNGSLVSAKRIQNDIFIQKMLRTEDNTTFFIAYDTNIEDYLTTDFASMLNRSYLGQMDENDEILWMKTTEQVFPIALKETNDGDIVFSAFLKEDKRAYLTKTSNRGEEIWSSKIPLNNSYIFDNVSTNDMGEILLFTARNPLEDQGLSHLLNINPDGEVNWTKIMPSAFQSVYTNSMVNVVNDAIILNYIGDDSYFYKLNKEGKGEQFSLPSRCIESESISFSWKDTLINFIGNTTGDIDWQATNGILKESTTRILDIPINPNQINTYFEIPDTTCINSTVAPTILPDNRFDFYDWTFENADTPKFNEREPEAVNYTNSGDFQVTLITRDENSCLDTFSRIITIIDIPAYDLGNDTILCEDQVFKLDAFSPDFDQYKWKNGTMALSLNIDQTGTYSITVTNDYCTTQDSINVSFINQIYSENPISLGVDTTICLDDIFALNVDHPNLNSLTWNDGDTKNNKLVKEEGIYEVTAIIDGCPFEESIQVDIIDCKGKVYIPNAFSPNNDGLNDELIIAGNNFELKSVQIFDRWGSLVFDQIDRPWDGNFNSQPLAKGTYVYQIIYLESLTNREKILVGTIDLIR